MYVLNKNLYKPSLILKTTRFWLSSLHIYLLCLVPVTTYVTTPKVVEAKLGEEARFYMTYTTPDNSSEFTVSRLGANGTEEVLRVVDLNVTSNVNWTMAANVETGVVDGDTRRINVTIYKTDFVTHEGDYLARVTGSDGAAQDLFTIRTLGKGSLLLCDCKANILDSRCTFKDT